MTTKPKPSTSSTTKGKPNGRRRVLLAGGAVAIIGFLLIRRRGAGASVDGADGYAAPVYSSGSGGFDDGGSTSSPDWVGSFLDRLASVETTQEEILTRLDDPPASSIDPGDTTPVADPLVPAPPPTPTNQGPSGQVPATVPGNRLAAALATVEPGAAGRGVTGRSGPGTVPASPGNEGKRDTRTKTPTRPLPPLRSAPRPTPAPRPAPKPKTGQLPGKPAQGPSAPPRSLPAPPPLPVPKPAKKKGAQKK